MVGDRFRRPHGIHGKPNILWQYGRPLAVMFIVTSFIGGVLFGAEGLKLALLALGLSIRSIVALVLFGKLLLLLLIPVREFVHGLRGV
jgi:hypothetical protein